MKLIRWRHGLPSYPTGSTEGIFNHTKIAVSHGSLMHTSVTLLFRENLHPSIILEGCINLLVPCQSQSTAARTIGLLIRCYFGGNGRHHHTIGACLEHEEQQRASLTNSKRLHCAQLPEEAKTDGSFSIPYEVGTDIQTQNRVDKYLPVSQVRPADLQSLDKPKATHALNDVPEDGVERVTDGNWSQSGQSRVDPALVTRLCLILEQNDWGPGTEEKLQQFVEKITSDVVTSVVSQQRNANQALSFVEWAGRQAGYEHRADTFTKVIGRLGKDKDFAIAWNVLQSMKEHGLDVNYAFSVLIHRLKSARMVEGVVEAMGCMRDLNITPTVPLYTNALQIILKENCLFEAQRLYLQMLQSGLMPDKTLYGVLISGFGMAGDLNKALHFFEEMKTRGFTPQSSNYTSLIRSYSLAGNYDEGHKLYKEMIQNDCWPGAFTEHELTCILHGKNTMEQIGFFLQDVDNTGHVLSIYTYNSMLQYLLDAGKLSEAVTFFHILLGKVQDVDGNCQNLSIRGVKLNLNSYTLLIFGLCKAEKVIEALKVFEEMLGSDVKPTNAICNNLLLYLSNAGLVDEAFELCDHISKLKLSVSAAAQKGFFSAMRTSGHLLAA